jgi:diguanylate cyclase (GGDEF)-like protein
VQLNKGGRHSRGYSGRIGDAGGRATDRLWLAYLGIGLTVSLLFIIAPTGPHLKWLTGPVTLSSAAAVIVGVRRHRPQNTRGWLMAATALSLIFSADVVYRIYGLVSGAAPFPSVADPVFLGGYLLFAAALVELARDRGAGRGTLIDAAITALPATAVLSVFVFIPLAMDAARGVGTVTALAYPTASLVLMAGALRLVFGSARRSTSTRLLLAGMAAWLVSDGYFAVASLKGTSHLSSLDDVGWIIASLLVGSAGLHPSMTAARRHRAQHSVLPAGRLIWLVGACLGCPVAAVVWDPQPRWVLNVASVAVVLLTAMRAAGPLHHLVRRAGRDDLTGLANRASLLEEVSDALASLPADGGRLAVLFCDLDHFKLVNDSFGHDVGDRLLIEIARRLRAAVREEDMVARLGGDEFVVVLAVPDELTADQLAERLAEALTEPLELPDGTELFPSMSIGVRTTDDVAIRPEDLLRDADTAMYQAKSAGRRRAERFDDRYRAEALETLRLEADLRHGITSGELFCVYQPEIDLITGSLFGFEALVRWRHPTEGVITPDRFVPLAETSGVVGDLFAAVLEEVLTHQERWEKALGWRPTVGVNLSPVQLADPNVVASVLGALDAHGAPADSLLVEVTETGLGDPDSVTKTLGELRRRGVRIAVDDFGTGYSSLARISQHPWDALKIDGSFVSRVDQDDDMRALVAATIAMAHALGMLAIAEGVETEEQLAVLRAMGCDIAQGYLLARPLDVDAALDHAGDLRCRPPASPISGRAVVPGAPVPSASATIARTRTAPATVAPATSEEDATLGSR